MSTSSPETLASVFEQLVLHLPDEQRQALANQVAALVNPSSASSGLPTHTTTPHVPSNITPSSPHPNLPFHPSITPPRPPTGNYSNYSPFHNVHSPPPDSLLTRMSTHVFPDLSALGSSVTGPSPFVGSIPHPSTRGVTAQDRSHQKSTYPFYLVAGGPWRGIFDSFAEAWAASVGFKGAGNPIGFSSWEAAEEFYFLSDNSTLPVPPPYICPTIPHQPRLGFWHQHYHAISYDERYRSSLNRERWLHNAVSHPYLPIRVQDVRPLHPQPSPTVPPHSTTPTPHPPPHPTPPHPSVPEDDFSLITSVPSSLSTVGPFPSQISVGSTTTMSLQAASVHPSVHPSISGSPHPLGHNSNTSFDLLSVLLQKPDPLPSFDGSKFAEWKTKLTATLSSPEWHDIHLQTIETPAYADLSARLYKKLIHALTGDALLPYSSNIADFRGQGIKLWNHLIETYEPSSSSALITLFLQWTSLSQGAHESIDKFASRVRALAAQLDRAGQPFSQELQLLFLLRGLLLPRFQAFYDSFVTGTKDLKSYNWTSFTNELHNFELSLKDRPSTSQPRPSPSSDIKPSDQAWIGLPNLTKAQSERLCQLFTCPIHRSNNHSLVQCRCITSQYTIQKLRPDADQQPTPNSTTKPPATRTPYPYRPTAPTPGAPPTSGGSVTRADLVESAQTPGPLPPPSATPTGTPSSTPTQQPADRSDPASAVAALHPSPPILSDIEEEDDDFTPQWSVGSGRHVTSNINSSNKPVRKYPVGISHLSPSPLPTILEHCLSASSAATLDNTPPSSPPLLSEPHAIADSGATDHFLKYRHYFDPSTFQPTPGCSLRLANESDVPVVGKGTASFSVNGVAITRQNCFLVPSLRSSLYSLRRHHRDPSCTYLGDNAGMFLTFPDQVIPIDDSVDCHITISSCPPPPPYLFP